MRLVLKTDNGESTENNFEFMEDAAKWCASYPEYGITLYPEPGEKEWDLREWQESLDCYFA